MRAFRLSSLFLLGLLLLVFACENTAQDSTSQAEPETRELSPRVRTGAELLLADGLNWVEGKKVAVVANQTSMVGDRHLVDTLLSRGIEVVKVFSPEHGFRGTADAGARISNSRDIETGLPIVSLYGRNKKPTVAQLADVDVVVFDIQDVGTRFYTYLSTMTYVLEACIEQQKKFLVLDRPNPNGWYVDGPVLEATNSSFIGLHEIPIVHGMTLGEYAGLVSKEGWLSNGISAESLLVVIPCEGYHHGMQWEETGLPWISPSPNLATEYAAYLYPAICWFEPTPVSVGRGTDSAFTLVGAPWYGAANARESADWEAYGLRAKRVGFTPHSLPGKSTYLKFQDEMCQGLDFQNRVEGKELFLAGLSLFNEMYLIHGEVGPDEPFFLTNFERWPGTTELEEQVKAGMSPEQIYESWQPKVEEFKAMRARYLLYPKN